MPRFYCPPPLPSSGAFDLPPDAAHHAARVLRLREGDPVQIFDGLGNERHGVIANLGGKRVVVSGIIAVDSDRESPLKVLLAQALSSSEKMDWVIQKATELGVAEIQPVDTERSVARLSAERAAKRLEHWQQVAISACEQCGRNISAADTRAAGHHGVAATNAEMYRSRNSSCCRKAPPRCTRRPNRRDASRC